MRRHHFIILTTTKENFLQLGNEKLEITTWIFNFLIMQMWLNTKESLNVIIIDSEAIKYLQISTILSLRIKRHPISLVFLNFLSDLLARHCLSLIFGINHL